MNWKELLDAFIKGLADELKGKSAEERKKIIAAASAELPQDVRQYLFDDGHSKATSDGKTKLKEAEDRAKAAEESVAAKDQEIEKLRKEKPDADAVRTEYEQKLSDKDNKHKTEIEKLRSEIQTTRTDSARALLSAALAPLVHAEIAEARILKAEKAGRIKFDEKSGEVRFYGEDGATPLQVPAGKTGAEVLAAEIAQNVPAEFRLSGAGGGAGEGSGGGAAGDKGFYDSIRNDVAGTVPKEAEQQLDTLAYS